VHFIPTPLAPRACRPGIKCTVTEFPPAEGPACASTSTALGVAAILENPGRFRGLTVATILCGANFSSADFERWVIQGG
jgi:hypothetical protein